MSRQGGHFNRQREAFYQAESLRVFVRDKVEPGTFDRLQEEIFVGVIDTRDARHDDGEDQRQRPLLRRQRGRELRPHKPARDAAADEQQHQPPVDQTGQRVVRRRGEAERRHRDER